MTPIVRLFALFIFVVGFSVFALAQASGELRKLDIANRIKNIRIIYSEPLKINAGASAVGFKGVAHTLLSEAQFMQLDQQLRNRNFANAFKKDGCYAKSHLISYELSRVGIKHSKIFIFGEKLGDIQVLGNHKPILFEFHVSPLVMVKMHDGKIIPHVLDFSFFDGPVKIRDWLDFFYKNSNVSVLKNTVMGPENIDPTWSQNKSNLYDLDLLYRFETEIDAFLLIIKRG